MISLPEDRILRNFRFQYSAAIILTVTIGLCVLAGWLLSIPTLVRISSALPETKPNASFALILSAEALWLLRVEYTKKISGRQMVGILISLAVASLGLLSLCEDLLGWNLGIDVSLRGGLAEIHIPNSTSRISPGAAVNFVLAGTALVLLPFKNRTARWVVQTLAFLAFLISVEALGGFVYRAHQLYRPMGFLAAIGTAILSLGILAARPRDAFMELVTASGAGGLTVRRLLPFVFLVPMILAWLRLVGQRAGIYDFEFGVELLVMSSVLCLAVILWWNSHSIDRFERERKHAEGLVRASSSYARSLIEASIDPLVTIDAGGKITDVNEASVHATGIQRDKLIGTDFSSYFTDPVKASEGYKKVLMNGFVRDYPLTIRHASGKMTDVLYNASIYRDEEGRPLGVFAAARDITDRLRAEQEIKRLLRVYAMLSGINEAIVRIHGQQELFDESCRIVVDLGKFPLAWIGKLNEGTGKVEVVSQAGPAASYVGTVDIDLNDQERSSGPTGRAIKSGVHCISSDIASDPSMKHWRARTKDHGFCSSASFPMKVHGRLWGAFSVYSDQVGFFNEEEVRLFDELVADIAFAVEAGEVEATRRNTEEALRQSEERLRYTMDNMLEGCMIIGHDWKYVYVNEAIARQGHQTKEKLVGRRMQDVYPGVEQSEVFQKYRLCMENRIPQHFESKYTFPDGVTDWFEFSTQPIPEGIFVLTVDISERKRAEAELANHQNRLEDLVRERTMQLESANKELEAFAYSVSHDLRAPLRHIDGFIGLLKKELGSSLTEKSARHIETISGSAKHMGTLIDDLLTFSRMSRQEMHSNRIDMTGLVWEVVRELSGEVRGRTIRWNIHGLPTIVGDQAMIKLALANLVSNAQKFTRKQAVAEIEIATIASEEKEHVFYIRDNGVGFDMEYVHKLFGVFQRLHNERDFEGTGIGLANVRRIIDRHGGRTWAEGAVNVGATFYFSLPCTN